MTVQNTSLNNRYQLLEQIGRGGMGEVFRARDRLNGQQIAVKLVAVPDELQRYDSSLGDELNPFLALAKEFELLATLKHPHVINVLDYGFAGPNRPYFTMDYLPCAKTIVEYGMLLTIPEKMQLFVNMLQALSYVHRRGIVHRDLKPSNVLVDSAGRVKVLDFGLSALQSPDISSYGVFIGTLPYMAPEVLDGEGATVGSDLYAAGTLAYELFQGRYPFDYGDLDEMIAAIQAQPPKFSEDLPINVVIARLMAKKTPDRFSDVSDVLTEIEDLVEHPIDLEPLEVRNSFLTAARFVGRDLELRKLESLVDVTLNGQANAVLIGGESGVGKSRLVEELRTRALVVGATVLTGQATREQKNPFALWQPIIRQLLVSIDVRDYEASLLKNILPDIDNILGKSVQSIEDIRRVPDIIEQLFRRFAEPLILILEDLQWQPEFMIFERLTNVPDCPLLLIGTYRSDELPELPEVLQGVPVMLLDRFDEQAMRELSRAILGTAGDNPAVLALLERETAGNTFFVVETLNALADYSGQLKQIGHVALPDKVETHSVQHLLAERTRRVPHEHYALLKLAAIAGHNIDLKVLENFHASIDIDQWLYICTNYAIIENRNQQWRFSHDRVRDVIIGSLTEVEKPALHERVAHALEAIYPDEAAIAAKLVEHWRQARNVGKEVQHLLVAAEFANISGRLDDVQYFAERGVSLITPEDDQLLYARLVLLKAAIASRLSDYIQAQTHYEYVLRIALELQNKRLESSALKGLGNVAMYTRHFSEAEEHYRAALDLSQDDRRTAELYANLGNLKREQRDYESSYHLTKDALSYARKINDPFRIAVCLLNLAAATLRLGHKDPIPYLKEALNIFRDMGNVDGEARVLINLGNYSLKIGDLTLASQYLEDCIAQEGTQQSPYLMTVALANFVETQIHSGQLGRAEHYLEKLETVSHQTSSHRYLGKYHFHLGSYYYFQNRFEDARASYHNALEIQDNIKDRFGKLETCGMLSEVCVLAGNYDAADKYLQIAIEIAKEVDLSDAYGIVHNHQGKIALAENRLTDAYRAYQRAFEEAQESRFILMVGEVLLGFGKVLQALGHTDLATQTLQHLIVHVPSSYWTIEEAKALLEQRGEEKRSASNDVLDLDTLMQRISEHDPNHPSNEEQ